MIVMNFLALHNAKNTQKHGVFPTKNYATFWPMRYFQHKNSLLKRRQSGFTLYECLCVLLIISILLLITMPTWNTFIVRNRVATGVENIMDALRLARGTAINQGKHVLLSKNGKTWSDGQIVIIKKTKKVIRTFPSTSYGDTLDWHGNLGRNDSIEFMPTGFPNGQQGSFYYCPKGFPIYAKAIIMNTNGRLRLSNKTAEGKKISCAPP
jgi:prepilin-type N-terminal cleavage/methylation domain-containing protein